MGHVSMCIGLSPNGSLLTGFIAGFFLKSWATPGCTLCRPLYQRGERNILFLSSASVAPTPHA